MNVILLQIFQQLKGERGKDQQDAALFVVKCKVQILKLKDFILEEDCEDCGKALCISPCIKIYHTEIDFKLHALKFREQGLQTVEIQDADGDDNE